MVSRKFHIGLADAAEYKKIKFKKMLLFGAPAKQEKRQDRVLYSQPNNILHIWKVSILHAGSRYVCVPSIETNKKNLQKVCMVAIFLSLWFMLLFNR